MITVLHIDDDKVDQMIFKRTIQAVDHLQVELVAIDNAELAFPVLKAWSSGTEKQSKPLVVLVDIHMPKCDGFEFLERLQKTPALQPTAIFMHTSSQRESDLQRAKRLGVQSVLFKDSGANGLAPFLSSLDALSQTS